MILVLRGMVNAAFALHLFTSPELEWTQGFLHLGYYAAVDGTLALILAVVMSAERERGPVLPAAVTAVDGVFRIGLALMTWLGPGIPYFALTSLLFFATIAACVSVSGIAWGFLALRGAHRKCCSPTLATAAAYFLPRMRSHLELRCWPPDCAATAGRCLPEVASGCEGWQHATPRSLP